ncbi:hypothetical protein [Methylobacterium iners]|uniref:Uncharacterized protein n=1 Tax=Methylobacterium iners TaxID=418707 RepID=A0ABQ4RTE5_9HYPH|nr:hypothetical protein [Methylobacterium iners]GJD92984.1 hypothetical protein OCOJLMKI_0169 [Methylobacterium iners]
MEITVRKTKKPSVYKSYLGDTLLCTTRQPFYDGARELLRMGYPSETVVNMRHQGKTYPSFVPTTLGEAAKLTVIENDQEGPKLVNHQANPFAEARR